MSWHDDRGSLPLALLAIIIIGSVSTVLVASTITGTRQTRFDQSFTTVVQAADSGVQEVANRIARGDLPTSGVALPAETLGDANYVVTPTKVSDTEWIVSATATINGVDRTVEAVVRDAPRFFLAAFADTGLSMAGGNGADSYGATAWYTGNGIIGTNEVVKLNGASSDIDGVHLYNWDAYPDPERCIHPGGSDCDGVKAMPEAIAPSARIGPALEVGAGKDFDTTFITDELAANGPLGSYTTSVDGATLGVAGATTKYWVQDMTINTDVTVVGDVEIYVEGSLSIGNAKLVNCATGCVAGTSVPDATALQIFSVGPSVVVGNHSKIAGAIYAPLADCEGNPSNAQAEVFGSMICKTISNQGGWQFHFDDRLKDEGTGTFKIGAWREVSP